MVPLNRREFIQATTAAIALPTLVSAADDAPLRIVDTHTHFYDPTRPQGVPWPSASDPFLYRPVLPEEYRKLAEPLGVVGTVVVEASAWVADNQWVLDLAAKNPFLLGLVGNLPPGSDDFHQHFPLLVKQPKWLGIRVNAGPLGMGIDRPEFLADLKWLADADKELDVNGGPALLPLVDKLAAKLPELRIVINHLANVRIDGPMVPDQWRTDLIAAAKHPQVFLKVSALVEGAAQGNRKASTDPAYYEPTLDAAWAAFGDDRVIYGSNWPVSARFADYATVQTIVQQYVRAKHPDALTRFFAGNPQAAYRWPN
ncbi:MAG TPA: amidohydrolase family protein [Planctomycetaceae bacterium]|nr:amidohydrolase family protein [Planctomycetaceae bacterium]